MKLMKIPKEAKLVIDKLEKAGFEAYLVGGCVRDILRNVEPEDWDVATNAKPKEIEKVFLHPPKFSEGKLRQAGSFADNKFGTVTVLTGSKNPKLKEIEVTPYRIDEKYTDKRHPDKIKWAKSIKEDLARRDFTINAMAAESKKDKLEIIDTFDGRKNLKNKIIQKVGNTEASYTQDA